MNQLIAILFLAIFCEASHDLFPEGNDLENSPIIKTIHSNVDAFLPPKVDVEINPRIIGGNIVEPPNRYPFMVSIINKYGSSKAHVCGGSLVAPNVVLSAAHCSDLADYVQIGRFDLSKIENFEEFEIVKKQSHPEYREDEQDFDYALFKLSGSSGFPPVTLNNKSNLLKRNEKLTVMGWGKEALDSDNGSSLLKETIVNYVTDSSCRSILPGLITDNMLCAKGEETDSCQGDSGGPIILADGTDLQVGIVSWGVGCADPVYPGVYADVSAQYSWIRSYICQWSPEFCTQSSGDPQDSDDGQVYELKTKYDGTNGLSGAMFDVKAIERIRIVSLNIHLISTITETVEVYSKEGTYKGESQNYAAWVRQGETKVIGRGEGESTPVPSGSFSMIEIGAGETVGLYITVRTSTFIYSNGDYEGAALASNNDLEIYQGIGVAYAFGEGFSPRKFNGVIKYQKVPRSPLTYNEEVENLHMTFVGLRLMGHYEEQVWSNVTSNFIENFYNVNGGEPQNGATIENVSVDTYVDSQEHTEIEKNVTLIARTDNISDDFEDELQIFYHHRLQYDTASTTITHAEVVLDPFAESIQRELYLNELRAADPSFRDIKYLTNIEQEESEDSGDDDFFLYKILFIGAIVLFCLVMAVFFIRRLRRRNKGEY